MRYEKIDGFVFVNMDCMDLFGRMADNSVDCIFTDIPYDGVRKDGDIRNIDKGKADIITFDLAKFCRECLRVCKGTIIIFCGKDQVSTVFSFFDGQKKGSTRQLIWEKTNPSPMNGQLIYLSGIENAIWYKKPKATFNPHCKNTVFRHPIGRSKIHPTEKNPNLIKEILQDNTTAGQVVFDPCMGSASTAVVCRELGLKFIGCELDAEFFDVAVSRFRGE